MSEADEPITGIVCPACGDGESDVRDSRATGAYIRRRRYCRACGHRFSTREIVIANELDRSFYRLLRVHQAMIKRVALKREEFDMLLEALAEVPAHHFDLVHDVIRAFARKPGS